MGNIRSVNRLFASARAVLLWDVWVTRPKADRRLKRKLCRLRGGSDYPSTRTDGCGLAAAAAKAACKYPQMFQKYPQMFQKYPQILPKHQHKHLNKKEITSRNSTGYVLVIYFLIYNQ